VFDKCPGRVRCGISPGARHRRLATFTVLLVTAAAYAGARAPNPLLNHPQPPLVIRNVGIRSMLSPDVERGTVVVRGDRISYVGGDTGMPDVPGARIVDGTGRYLIPGLMDLHTHVAKARASSLSVLKVFSGPSLLRPQGSKPAWLQLPA
jgi:hypothetical protein